VAALHAPAGDDVALVLAALPHYGMRPIEALQKDRTRSAGVNARNFRSRRAVLFSLIPKRIPGLRGMARSCHAKG